MARWLRYRPGDTVDDAGNTPAETFFVLLRRFDELEAEREIRMMQATSAPHMTEDGRAEYIASLQERVYVPPGIQRVVGTVTAMADLRAKDPDEGGIAMLKVVLGGKK